MNKILIIEDDLEINALLADFLKEKGYAVHCQYDGLHVLDFLNKEKIDLIILDIMLPYRSGDIILSDVRKKFTIPVIIISAKETTQNKIDLLRLGADDYITKPFGMMEFVARVKAVLRRCSRQEDDKELKCQDLALSVGKHKVCWKGEKIELTRKEFELLQYLMENKGLVMTRNQILCHVWGYDFDGETRTVDVHVRTLRQKLGEAGNLVETVRGVGYRIGA